MACPAEPGGLSGPTSAPAETGTAGSRVPGELTKAASSPGVTGGKGTEPGVVTAALVKSLEEAGVRVSELEGEGWLGATLTEAWGVRSWSSSMAVTAVRLLWVEPPLLRTESGTRGMIGPPAVLLDTAKKSYLWSNKECSIKQETHGS